MQAIILAAGEGSRMRDRRGRPKCLREVGGEPLVRHQLRALSAVGISDVTVVVGYEHHQVRSEIGGQARYVLNLGYAETNSMYSYLLAAPAIADDVLVMNSDLFCHPGFVSRLLDSGPDALLFDSGSGEEDEQMKIQTDDGRLVQMSKTMSAADVHGENVGMLHLSAGTARAAASAAARIVDSGHRRAWLAEAINEIAPRHPIACVDVAGSPWVEIDFPQDLAHARSEIYPALAQAIAEPVRLPAYATSRSLS
jgi:choline kinase